MDRVAFSPMSCFHNHLAEGRVGMHIAADFADGQFGALGKGQLRQQFGDIGADHLGTEQFAVFGVGDDFDEPGVISEAEGLAVGLEGEAPDLDGVTLFLDLAFGTGDADLVFGEQFGGAHVHVNFVFLHQRADAQGDAF